MRIERNSQLTATKQTWLARVTRPLLYLLSLPFLFGLFSIVAQLPWLPHDPSFEGGVLGALLSAWAVLAGVEIQQHTSRRLAHQAEQRALSNLGAILEAEAKLVAWRMILIKRAIDLRLGPNTGTILRFGRFPYEDTPGDLPLTKTLIEHWLSSDSAKISTLVDLLFKLDQLRQDFRELPEDEREYPVGWVVSLQASLGRAMDALAEVFECWCPAATLTNNGKTEGAIVTLRRAAKAHLPEAQR